MEKQFKYDAFISYRHMDLDKTVAKNLQKLLETYNIPKKVVSERQSKIKVFRDESELHSSSNLSDEIKFALESSKFLIVICSEDTKPSKWCTEEIRYFKSLHNGSNLNIIPLVVSGNPSDVFPDELCYEQRTVIRDGNTVLEKFEVEPLAANVSAANKAGSLKLLRTEFLRIAAALLDCGYDALYNREQKRKLRKIISASVVVAVILALFGLYTSVMLYKINVQKNIAVENEAKANEANRNLKIKNAEILSNQAEIYLKNDDAYLAVDTALQALEMLQDVNGDANVGTLSQRIIADVTGAYSAKDRMLCDTVNLSGYVNYIKFSEDGKRIFAKDSNGIVYIIDSENGKIIKSFTPLDTFGHTSENIKAVAVDGDFGYVLCNSQIISINLNDGSVNWHCKENELYLCFDEILVNKASDYIIIPGLTCSVAIDKESGTAKLIEHKQNRSYSCRTYLDSMGNLYCVDRTAKMLYVTDCVNDAEHQITFDIPDGCKVLSMGEGKDCFYITFVTPEENVDNASLGCGLIMSINKEDLSLLWQTSFDGKYLSDYNFNKTFELSHTLMDNNGEYYNVTGAVVVSGVNVLAFDANSSKQYFKTESEDGEEILYFDYDGSKLYVGFSDSFNYSTYIFKGTQYGNLSKEDVLLNYDWYDYDREYKYTDYDGVGKIAVSENKSSTIRIYSKKQKIPDVVFDGMSDLEISYVNGVTDNGNGVVAICYYLYDDNIKYNYIVFYDINNNEVLSYNETEINVKNSCFINENLLFVVDDGKNAAVYDLGCNKICDMNISEVIDAPGGAYTGVYYVYSYNGLLYYCVSDGIFEIDFSQGKPSVRVIEQDGYLSEFCMNDGVISYLKNDYKNNSVTVNYINADMRGFVTNKGEKSEFLLGSVNLVSNSGADCRIAFVSKEGYIGVYSHSDESLKKIKIPREEVVPIKLVFAPNKKHIIALCSNGNVIKYSIDTLNEVGRYVVDFEVSKYSELYFVNENTFAVREYSQSDVLLLVNCDSMELKAELDSFVYTLSDGEGFICRCYNGNDYVYGYYNHRNNAELMELARAFLESKS